MITITDKAQEEFQRIMKEEGASANGIRMGVKGGGCSGFQYGFNFEPSAASDDSLLERDGVTVAVDPMSYQYLIGAEVDYKEDLQGARFVINNPNATTTCGCVFRWPKSRSRTRFQTCGRPPTGTSASVTT